MKNLLLIILFLSVGFSQQKKSDEPNPKKGIKTETILKYEYEEKFGEFNEIFKSKDISKYDSNGNRVEHLYYGSDGSLLSKYISQYDSKGNKVEESRYDSDGSLFLKYVNKYDSNGNEIESSNYDSDGSLMWKYIYKYDSKNRIIESISYDLESKFGELQEIPTKKTIYQYEEY